MDRSQRENLFENERCQKCHELLEQMVLEQGDGSGGMDHAANDHLAECSDCRAFASALEAMSEIPYVSDDLVRRATDDFFSNKNRLWLRPGRVIPIAATFAAAAAVLIMVSIWTAPETATTLPIRIVAGSPRVEGSQAPQGTLLAEGQHLFADSEQTLVVADETLSIGIDSKSGLVLDSLRSNNVELGLEKGRIAVHLEPERRIKLAVSTRVARVVVTGTLFSVEATSNDISVRVVRGSVRVESPLWPNDPVEVRAGSSLRVKTRIQSPLEPRSRKAILSLLRMSPPEPKKIARAGDVTDRVDVEEVALDTELREASTGSDDKSPNVPSARDSRQRRRISSKETREENLSLNELIRSARRCRASRNWSCSVSAYENVIRNYPRSAEAATVLLPLAQIELENLGRPARALRYYQAYRRKRPSGPLGQEALYGTCRAFSALGQTKNEAEALGEFLRLYPRSVNASNARARLNQLSQSKKR